MNQNLTVVLPIHNAEPTLRRSVDRLLDVAAELTPRFELLIVDDGSTDDSFDVASELAARFPQVRVMRSSRRRGLGPTLERVRRRIKSDVVMVHDGVSEISPEQLRQLWNEQGRRVGPVADASMSDLLRPSQNQAAMAAAHRRLMGFQLLSQDQANPEPATGEGTPSAKPPTNKGRKPGSVGAIPTLPRPNFLDAIGDFAVGE